MKLFTCFTAVVLISCLVWKTNTEIVKRGSYNAVEVIDDDTNGRADLYMRRGRPVVQFFAFGRLDWNSGSSEMSKTSFQLLFNYFLSYNCVDKPQYCPSDVTKTSYRFYKNRELKKTVEDDQSPILASWQIKNAFKDL